MLNVRLSRGLKEKNTWEPSSEYKGIRVRFEHVTVDIPLCVTDRPRRGSFVISRQTDGWCIAPSMFVIDRDGAWWAKGSCYHQFAPYEFLFLAGGDKLTDIFLEEICALR